jgi:hypothetical protein
MEALGWLDTTTPLVPWINGRKLVNVVPGTGTVLSSLSQYQSVEAAYRDHAHVHPRRQANSSRSAFNSPFA